MTTNAIQSSHIYSTYFAPRGRSRIYTLGMQIAQLYLSPFDQIIGFIGEAGSGKSVLIKGMFPGIELTNDDDGVNVRPLPSTRSTVLFAAKKDDTFAYSGEYPNWVCIRTEDGRTAFVFKKYVSLQ